MSFCQRTSIFIYPFIHNVQSRISFLTIYYCVSSKGDQEVNISLDLDVCLKNDEWWRENFNGCSNAVGYVSWMICSCRLSKSDAKFLPELDEDLISGLVIDSSWLALDFKKIVGFFHRQKQPMFWHVSLF